jgi:cation transporter-like permease
VLDQPAWVYLLFFVSLAFIGSVIGALVLGLLNVYVTGFAIKHHWDPDNTTLPILTTSGDIVMVLIVYLLALLLKQVLLTGAFA